jgi:SH3 domain
MVSVLPHLCASLAALALVQEKESSASSDGEVDVLDGADSVQEAPPSILSSSSSVECVCALWDFASENQEELSFKKGDIISVLEYDGVCPPSSVYV